MKNRALKRWKRENRKNKGVSTAARIQKRQDEIRKARSLMGGWDTPDIGALLFAAALMGRK